MHRSKVRSSKQHLQFECIKLKLQTTNQKPETKSMTDIKVPTVGESINEVTLLRWVKNDGGYVERDEVIAELESEKATFEVNAEKAGVLKVSAKEGDTLKIGDTLATIDESAAKPEKAAAPVAANGKQENGTQKAEAAIPKTEP